jgi:hypothetical protein
MRNDAMNEVNGTCFQGMCKSVEYGARFECGLTASSRFPEVFIAEDISEFAHGSEILQY